MASSSPAEFLTFFRTASRATQALRTSHVRTTLPVRPFSSSVPSLAGADKKGDMGGENQDKKHVLEKDTHLNVQESSSKEGRAKRATNDGGAATEERNPGVHEKAKKEFPEAPTTIGFEDERGGKGH